MILFRPLPLAAAGAALVLGGLGVVLAIGAHDRARQTLDLRLSAATVGRAGGAAEGLAAMARTLRDVAGGGDGA